MKPLYFLNSDNSERMKSLKLALEKKKMRKDEKYNFKKIILTAQYIWLCC